MSGSLCTHCGGTHPEEERTCPVTRRKVAEPGLCGRTVDRYRIERWIGGGGFGAVYRAEHLVMKRKVALKVLNADLVDPAMTERFFQESRAAARIGHPHIVPMYDAGTTDDGHPFIAMEHVDGCSLAAVLERGALPPARAVKIALQLLDALAAAHREGVVHRDVKPANVMLQGTRPDGRRTEDFVKLVDFGISKMREGTGSGELTATGIAMGTPGFAAPEQYMSARSVDHRADLYSLATLLFAMLAGRRPFDADTYERMVVRVCTEDPPSVAQEVPNLPEALVRAVDRGLARSPEQRWQSASELAGALREAAAELGVDWESRSRGSVDASTRPERPAALAPASSLAAAESEATSSMTDRAMTDRGAMPDRGADTDDLSTAPTMATPSIATDPVEDVGPQDSATAPTMASSAPPPPAGARDTPTSRPLLSDSPPRASRRAWVTGLVGMLGLGVVAVVASGAWRSPAPEPGDALSEEARSAALPADTAESGGTPPEPQQIAREARAPAPEPSPAEREAAGGDGADAGTAPGEPVANAAVGARLPPKQGPQARTRTSPPPRKKPQRKPVGEGTVDIQIPRGWASVLLDGRAMGQAPGQFVFPAGVHLLELRPYGRGPSLRYSRFEVEAGKHMRFPVSLPPEPSR